MVNYKHAEFTWIYPTYLFPAHFSIKKSYYLQLLTHGPYLLLTSARDWCLSRILQQFIYLFRSPYVPVLPSCPLVYTDAAPGDSGIRFLCRTNLHDTKRSERLKCSKVFMFGSGKEGEGKLDKKISNSCQRQSSCLKTTRFDFQVSFCLDENTTKHLKNLRVTKPRGGEDLIRVSKQLSSIRLLFTSYRAEIENYIKFNRRFAATCVSVWHDVHLPPYRLEKFWWIFEHVQSGR